MERCEAAVLRVGWGASFAGTVGVVSRGQHFCLPLFVELNSQLQGAGHARTPRHSSATQEPPACPACYVRRERNDGLYRWGMLCEGGGGLGQKIIFVERERVTTQCCRACSTGALAAASAAWDFGSQQRGTAQSGHSTAQRVLLPTGHSVLMPRHLLLLPRRRVITVSGHGVLFGVP